jgi:hypothetical protein
MGADFTTNGSSSPPAANFLGGRRVDDRFHCLGNIRFDCGDFLFGDFRLFGCRRVFRRACHNEQNYTLISTHQGVPTHTALGLEGASDAQLSFNRPGESLGGLPLGNALTCYGCNVGPMTERRKGNFFTTTRDVFPA